MKKNVILFFMGEHCLAHPNQLGNVGLIKIDFGSLLRSLLS